MKEFQLAKEQAIKYALEQIKWIIYQTQNQTLFIILMSKIFIRVLLIV